MGELVTGATGTRSFNGSNVRTTYHFGRARSAESSRGFGPGLNSGIVASSSPPVRCVPSVAPRLLAADDGVALDFDLGLGDGQGGDGDEGAAGEIVAQYFAPKLGEAGPLTALS